MSDSPASRAAAAAWVTVLLFIGCLSYIIWRANRVDDEVPVLWVLVSLAMACTIVLHLVFVALLARRLGKRARWYVLGALLTLPLGSLVGLILYEWHTTIDRPNQGRAA